MNQMTTPLNFPPGFVHTPYNNGSIWCFLTHMRSPSVWSVASDKSIHDVFWKVNEICPPARLRYRCPSAVSYLLFRAISFSKQCVGRNSSSSSSRCSYKFTITGKSITGVRCQRQELEFHYHQLHIPWAPTHSSGSLPPPATHPRPAWCNTQVSAGKNRRLLPEQVFFTVIWEQVPHLIGV